MTTVETIHQKVLHLPPQAQEEVLEAVERISERFETGGVLGHRNGERPRHPLAVIAEMATDVGVSDLAERHDFYAHGKLEE